MSGAAVPAALAAVLLAVAAALLVPPAPRRSGRIGRGAPPPPVGADTDGLLRRGRLWWALAAGAGAAVVVGGPLAVPAGVVGGLVVWRVAGRLEPRAVVRRREEVRRDLPHVVTLLAAALRSDLAPVAAVETVARALPGAAAQRLVPVAARLRLGADAGAVWAALADDPELGPLGRTLARAHRTGTPVVGAVERLAVELARRARAEVEDRARSVGVRAAVPLGLCLLPSFLFLGVVPLAVSLAAGVL